MKAPLTILLTILLALTSLLLPCSPVLAWSGAGHQVIAAEAYRQLTPALKTNVAEILKAHPDYRKWEKSFTPESANPDLPTFIFIRSSTWPELAHVHRQPIQTRHISWTIDIDTLPQCTLYCAQEEIMQRD